MRLFRFATVLAMLAFLGGSPKISLADFHSKQVIVTNSTVYTMTEFYASPSANSSWDTTTNLLLGQSIAPGQTSTITISDGIDHCHYDLMAVLYGNAEYAYTYEVNTCAGGTWNVQQGSQ